MTKRIIDPVANNLEKYYTYREYISRYKRAIKEAFYYEALLIDYAMLEDRLRSFLYHMGALRTRNSFSVDFKKSKLFLKQILEEYTDKDEAKNLGISSITGKIRILRCVALWAFNSNDVKKDDSYEYVLKSRMEEIDIDRLLQTLSSIQEWCKYRNEIIHCLLNKNIASVNLNLAEQAEKGFVLARELDAQLRLFKKGNFIRKKMRLPIDDLVKVPKENQQ